MSAGNRRTFIPIERTNKLPMACAQDNFLSSRALEAMTYSRFHQAGFDVDAISS